MHLHGYFMANGGIVFLFYKLAYQLIYIPPKNQVYLWDT